ncbi:hypothetical protein X986_3898 [Burkholderia pseudomallei]|uniref:hypothetical protein n=1 Tax=Burkholderia pseudomallei TaxID=28450 RepID=UPI000537C40A|nr:hypothetical protein [Burkholderia pseudomallei]KGX12503.1 hypothetical protein X984_3589 [Burkholderia pseudomallei]KGX27718.1 hypothetical protein X986_3898 [Burkholderia pseudomallei]
MNDQQQSRADALTVLARIVELDDGKNRKAHKPHPERYQEWKSYAAELPKLLAQAREIVAASPVEQPALLTAQDALAAIETFEIVGDNNDSREPNAEDRFILTEFVAHLFGGFRVELPAAAPASANETGAEEMRDTAMRTVQAMGLVYTPGSDRWRPNPNHAPAAAAVAPADERAAGMPDEVRDSMMDSQYLAGVTAGWNAANADDPNAALKKIHDAYSGYLNPLRDWQKAGRPGAPATPATADERAECIAWANANGFPKYHESMCAAWEERARRAAASPAAEVVRLQHVATAEDGGKLRWMTGRRPRDCELYAMPDGGRAPATLYTAPQPAQADAPARIEALRKGLFEARDAMRVMSNWAKKSDPAGHSWAVRMMDRASAVLNGESSTAQADALGEEAYVAKRMTETLATVYTTIIGDDEVDTDDGLNAIERVVRAAQVLRLEVDLYRAQADAPDDTHKFKNFHRRLCERFGYVHDEIDWRRDQVSLIEWIAKKADAPAEAREPIAWVTDDDRAITAAQKQRALADGGATASSVRPYSIPCYAVSAPADAGEAAPFGWAQPKGGNYFTRNELSAKRIGGLVPVYTAPPAARVASLTDEQRESIEHAATWLARSEDLQNKAHAKRLCDLLNGMDHDR